MKNKTITSVLFAWACFFVAMPQSKEIFTPIDSSSVISYEGKLIKIIDPIGSLRGAVWENPSLAFYRYGVDVQTMEITGWKEDRGRAALAQEGNEDKAFRLSATSRLRFSPKDGLLGRIAFERGRKENVTWNEIADFRLFYPYLVGDSAGTYMNRQSYQFMGAYFRELGRWNCGAQFDYRAAVVSRDKDPRPLNIVSDIKVKLSGAYHIGNYRLGTSVNYRYYSQQHKVIWLGGEGGSMKQMSGLGFHYKTPDFSTHPRCNYIGSGYGGSLDLMPVNGRGWSASAGINHFHFLKEINMKNYPPINTQDMDIYRAEVAWIQQTNGYDYGAGVSVQKEHRQGYETVFDHETANSDLYQVKNMREGLKIHTEQASIFAIFGKHMTSGFLRQYSILPMVAWFHSKADYEYALSSLEIGNFLSSLSVQAVGRVSKECLLTLELQRSHTTNRKAVNALGYPEESELDSYKVAGNNFYYFADPFHQTQIRVRADYHISDKWGIYMQTVWRHQKYKLYGSTQYGEVAMGLLF